MENKKLIIDYVEYGSLAELPDDARRLMECVMESAHKAYAPYSKFHVGAAVRLANGAIVLGNNIENAAYPSGLCAERVAMFGAMAQYPGVPIQALAITAWSATKAIEEPVAPCGSCRQVMVEVEQTSTCPLRVLCQGETGPIMVFDGVESLMPFIFLDKFL